MEDELNKSIHLQQALLMQEELLKNPEVIKKLKAIAQKHWENWLDEPISVLDDKTPRQAALTDRGRKSLEALFLEYEISNSCKLKEDPFKADVGYLKSRLGIKHLLV